VTDTSSRRVEELIRARDTLHGIKKRRGRRIEPRGQSFHLLDIEDGVAFQEGNIPLGFLSALPIRLGTDCDLACIDDEGPNLALADMRPMFERLLERHPDRGSVTARDRFAPQHDDIDALIRDSVRA
jgi:hypothetical protein